MKKITTLFSSALIAISGLSHASTCDNSTITINNHTNLPIILDNISTSRITPFPTITGGMLSNLLAGQTINANSTVVGFASSSKGSRGDASGLLTLVVGDVSVYVDYSFTTNDTFGLSACAASKQITQSDGITRVVVSSDNFNGRPPGVVVDIYTVS